MAKAAARPKTYKTKYNKQTQAQQYYKKKAKYQKKKAYGGRYRTADGGSIGRSVLTGGAEMLGGLFGMGPLGKAAGEMASNIIGLGDYEISKNVFLNGRLPQMTNISIGGGTLIRFQEYLGDIITSGIAGGFSSQTFIINPGLQASYPFLSQIACNYEQYSIEGMVYGYKSTSGDGLNSTNTALGSVMMATQYDVSDAVFGSKGEILNYEFASSCKPSENMVHLIECAPRQNVLTELFTRWGAVPAHDDARMYDLGRVCVATTGFQSTNVNIGELYVSYQVRLLKPKIVQALGYMNGLYIAQAAPDTVMSLLPLGINHTLGSSNTLTLVISSTGVAFPRTSLQICYLVEYQINGFATPANITWPVVTGVAGTISGNTQWPANSSNMVGGTLSFYFKTSGAAGSTPAINFGTSGTFPTSGTPNMVLTITQVPSNTA